MKTPSTSKNIFIACTQIAGNFLHYIGIRKVQATLAVSR